jgi:16S rRNA A1518/A1519 N6-dimethyltransferase RsmA/KsgA/DIM1 with predicted DNA glycosylase/AP lyase activity
MSCVRKKSLGQNFLLDLNLTARIARAGGPLDGVNVLEVGPGPGGLTRALIAQGARVVAIERDERAIAALGEIAARYPRIGLRDRGRRARRSIRALTSRAPARVIANLPYNIATALLVQWSDHRTVAALVRSAGADVPARGGAAHHRHARLESLWAAVGARGLAHQGAHSF